MLKTPSGIVTFSRAEQYEKVYSLIAVTPFGMVTLFREEQ